jgi:hypothetical protein
LQSITEIRRGVVVNFEFRSLAANHQRRAIQMYWAALLTIGAALIHFAGAVGQVPRSDFWAALLSGYGLVQLVVAFAILAIPATPIFIGALIVQASGVFLWILAHTTGLPIGNVLWRPEALSVPGLFLPVMESFSVLLLLQLLLRRPSLRAPRARVTALLTLLALPPIVFLTWSGVNFAANDTWLSSSLTIAAPTGALSQSTLSPSSGKPQHSLSRDGA